MKTVVYTIAKNEEKHVRRWAESCKDADYRFILDTGSTDKTMEIAKELGIPCEQKIFDPFAFDTSRNEAISRLPLDVDYCISLDMDEQLSPNWKEDLKRAYELKVNRPYHKVVIGFDKDGNGVDYFLTSRIHGRKGFKWVHPIHENLVADGTVEETRCDVGLEVLHHPDKDKPRKLYLTLLEEAVKANPLSDRYSHYLAREYFIKGMPEKAAPEFKRHVELSSSVWNAEKAESMRYIAKCPGEDTRYWLQRAYEICPERRETIYDLVKYYYIQKEWKKCLELAEEAIKIDKNRYVYFNEEEAWSYRLYDFASLAAWTLDEYKKAFEYCLEAYLMNPSEKRIGDNLKLFKTKVKVITWN